jgi:F0F1-type ATP synthase membrane subunit b/b'
MQKVIFVLISIIILSLIGCGGLVGQGTGNEKSTNSDQIQSDLVEALEKVVKLTEESEQLRSEIDTLNQQADNIRADIEEDWQKRNEELEKNYQDEINKIIEEIDQDWLVRIEKERNETESNFQSIINQTEEDWQKIIEELEKNYQDEINKLIKRSDDSNRKVDEARIRLEDALRTIEDLNKESLRLQGELSKALNK